MSSGFQRRHASFCANIGNYFLTSKQKAEKQEQLHGGATALEL
jgi:hypothetical protein